MEWGGQRGKEYSKEGGGEEVGEEEI